MKSATELDFEAVLAEVRRCLEASCNVQAAEIGPDQGLIKDIGMDSIDFVDLFFQLEKAFDIKLPMGSMEAKIRKEMGDEPFEVDTVITARGLELLKAYMPELPEGRIKPGLSIYEVPELLTVRTLCRIVMEKLKEKK